MSPLLAFDSGEVGTIVPVLQVSNLSHRDAMSFEQAPGRSLVLLRPTPLLRL